MKPLPFWIRMVLWAIGALELVEDALQPPRLLPPPDLERLGLRLQREQLLQQLAHADMHLSAALGPYRCLAKCPPPGDQ